MTLFTKKGGIKMSNAINVVVEVKDGMVVGVYSTDTNVSVEVFDHDIFEAEDDFEKLVEQEYELMNRVQSGELHDLTHCDSY